MLTASVETMTEPHDNLENLSDDLEEVVDGLRFNVPLRRFSTMRVGGSADIFGQIHSAEALHRVLVRLDDAKVPFTVIGLGSNLVMADEGVRGLVARLGGALSGVRTEGEGVGPTGSGDIIAELGAGTVNAHAVRDLHAAGLVGAELLALVPGTVGGAVAMNAGARWGELSDILDSIEVVDTDGSRWLDADSLDLSYRHCVLPESAWVTRARVRLQPGDTSEAARRVRDEKAYREAT